MSLKTVSVLLLEVGVESGMGSKVHDFYDVFTCIITTSTTTRQDEQSNAKILSVM